MSRSVSLPSSVTNTSPCWNGLIVPGSMFRYGSNFCTWTFRPRAFSSRPREAATMPFPSAETTPPVTNTYFVGRSLMGSSGSGSGLTAVRSGRFPGESPRARNLAWARSRASGHGRRPPGRTRLPTPARDEERRARMQEFAVPELREQGFHGETALVDGVTASVPQRSHLRPLAVVRPRFLHEEELGGDATHLAEEGASLARLEVVVEVAAEDALEGAVGEWER